MERSSLRNLKAEFVVTDPVQDLDIMKRLSSLLPASVASTLFVAAFAACAQANPGVTQVSQIWHISDSVRINPNINKLISRPAWVVTRGELPKNALKVGYDAFVTEEDGHVIAKTPATSLYLCRAIHEGTIYPGKYVNGSCSISVNGVERHQKISQVLVNVPSEIVRWDSIKGEGFHPLHGLAFASGGDSAQKFNTCRAAYKAGLHPGRIVGSQCLIGWRGIEVAQSNYDILYIQGVKELKGAVELSRQCYPATDEPLEEGTREASVCNSRPLK